MFPSLCLSASTQFPLPGPRSMSASQSGRVISAHLSSWLVGDGTVRAEVGSATERPQGCSEISLWVWAYWGDPAPCLHRPGPIHLQCRHTAKHTHMHTEPCTHNYEYTQHAHMQLHSHGTTHMQSHTSTMSLLRHTDNTHMHTTVHREPQTYSATHIQCHTRQSHNHGLLHTYTHTM